jgi:hypothetical protein
LNVFYIFCIILFSSDEISEEIELLKAIYVHELEVVGPEERLEFDIKLVML